MAEPLCPRTLEQYGILRAFPPAPEAFRPDGSWKQSYRIWGGHGWIGVGYKTIGILDLERVVSPDQDGDIRFRIEQKVVYQGGILHTLRASASARNDALASLRKWELESTMTNTSGEVDRRLSLSLRGETLGNGKQMELRVGDAEPKAEDLGGLLVSDWTLFDTIQRLPFSAPASDSFDLLEGLSARKRGFSLHYRNRPEDGLAEGPDLHRFYLLGRGQLPTDFWVDKHHRLLIAISGSRAWIRDDDAESLFMHSLTNLREGGQYHV